MKLKHGLADFYIFLSENGAGVLYSYCGPQGPQGPIKDALNTIQTRILVV